MTTHTVIDGKRVAEPEPKRGLVTLLRSCEPDRPE